MHYDTLVLEKVPSCSIDPKGMSAVQRPKEFTEKMITASAGKLFCSACQEELLLKLGMYVTLCMQKLFTRHRLLMRKLNLSVWCILKFLICCVQLCRPSPFPSYLKPVTLPYVKPGSCLFPVFFVFDCLLIIHDRSQTSTGLFYLPRGWYKWKGVVYTYYLTLLFMAQVLLHQYIGALHYECTAHVPIY